MVNWVIKCGLDDMGPVYERLHEHLLEREYADLDAAIRKAKRLDTESVIWEAYWSLPETVNPDGVSRLPKAVTYVKNQYPQMETYLMDG